MANGRTRISQNWENRNSPDNNEGTKLKWLKNMKTHLKVNADNECWIWWDLICVPQHNRELQKKAIASLAYYATLCSRFIPLVRDRKEWEKLYEDRSSFDECVRACTAFLDERPNRAALLVGVRSMRRLNAHHYSCWHSPRCHQRMYVILNLVFKIAFGLWQGL